VILNKSPVLGAPYQSNPYVVWRWVPEGPRYVSETMDDPNTGFSREARRVDVPDGAIVAMTPDGKFMVGEVMCSATAP
jgi:hypothetical protein